MLKKNQTNLFSFFKKNRDEEKIEDKDVESLVNKKRKEENPNLSNHLAEYVDDEVDGSDNEEFIPMKKIKKNEKKDEINTDQDKILADPKHNIHSTDHVLSQGEHEHNFFEFLSKNRKDKNGFSFDHPEFDHRTLKVPLVFEKELTPAMAQWWLVKSNNMDTVLFFKVGKFYELFHMDADVGFTELDLIYMKGSKAHSGFPEIAFGKFCNILVLKGYRVARVEQTETPEMMKERNETAKKKDKVVSREVCSAVSMGTRTFCHFDEFNVNDANLSASVLMSVKVVKQKGSDDNCSNLSTDCDYEFGVCLIDCVIGSVTLIQFLDNTTLTKFRTLLSMFSPSEVLLEAGDCYLNMKGVVSLLFPKCKIEVLRKDLEMLSVSAVTEWFKTHHYFLNSKNPEVLDVVLDDSRFELVLSALGGAIWQLHRSLIDHEILSMGKFVFLSHLDNTFSVAMDENSKSVTECSYDTTCFSGSHSMTLDEVALTNLEVLVNNFDRSDKGSLWSFVNRSHTAFGRRLLHSWLCHPLFKTGDILNRRCAIEELIGDAFKDEIVEVKNLMKDLPDLERLLSRVHSNGLHRLNINHPDGRAVLYENSLYTSRKIKDFVAILSGFENLVKIGKIFDKLSCNSQLLERTMKKAFPLLLMDDLLKNYRKIFDEKQAKKDGNIRPNYGVNPDYDLAKEEVLSYQNDLEQYLADVKRQLNIADLKYFGVNKDRYQIEVSIANISKVPGDWTTKSQKKTHRRYWTKFIESKLILLVSAEERLKSAQDDTLRKIFERFSSKQDIWSNAVGCIAVLDGLLALSSVSSTSNYTWPEIIDRGVHDQPFLHIRNGRHPMLEFALSQRGHCEYIPNDLLIGGSCGDTNNNLSEILLLSGPNMGGKSTLLRQTCLIVILAQLGCKVPADSVTFTPVDRIFTRIGATDRILSGQSTFFVELSETAAILKSATQDSLCILDELGRGTATFDGTAIAHSVVDFLVKNIHCRALFATHYHSLIDDWKLDSRVQLGHMSCVVANQPPDKKTTHDVDSEMVTFLYKLSDGSSPHSYGINVARLAKMPVTVVQVAMRMSNEFEKRMKGSPDIFTKKVNFSNKNRGKLLLLHKKLMALSHNFSERFEIECESASQIWSVCNNFLIED